MLPPHLRHLLRRCLPASPSALRHPNPSNFSVRRLSSAAEDTSDLAQSISSALIHHSQSPQSSDLPRHLSLHFSDVRFNKRLLIQILSLSAPAGRAAADLFRWAVRRCSFSPSDESLSHLVSFLGRRYDFPSIHDVLLEFRRAAGPKTVYAALDRLARAGRPSQAVRFFDNMERDYGIRRDRATLGTLVSTLCVHGYGGHAEHVVKRYADQFFPDEAICYELIRGWCSGGKLDDAMRLMGEMARGGFELGTPAYNAILDCVCLLCRKKDPLRLQVEAGKVLLEMEAKGVPRDAETFAVLVTNLCKIRKTEDALKLFEKMPEWGCSPTAEIYLVLIRSLYQAARLAEGDQMIEKMRSSGFKGALDRKAYYGFIKILCGVERVNHAMKVFGIAKGYGFVPGVKTYSLLLEKLFAHNQASRADALSKEAAARGVVVPQKLYKVDPRYVKKPKEKKGPKRLTLPEKMARKRRRLKKLRLSFVKKPRAMRRA